LVRVNENGICCILLYEFHYIMFEHNSGTPGAISTKLGTGIAICMCKNCMYILYTYIPQGGWCGRPGIWVIHIVEEINLLLLYNRLYIYIYIYIYIQIG
jgi:hypothetical protein